MIAESETLPCASATHANLDKSVSPLNPLVILLQKQISEILKSTAAESEDGQSLLATLCLQLANIEGRCAPSAPPNRDTTTSLHACASTGDPSFHVPEEIPHSVEATVSQPLQVSPNADPKMTFPTVDLMRRCFHRFGFV